MEHIGALLLMAGALGLVLSLWLLGRRRPVRLLNRSFDFGEAKRFENTR
jgi:hypothetical protein